MTETLTSRFEIRPASPLIGAEINGVDLTQPVDEGTAQALREAFWTHKVLVSEPVRELLESVSGVYGAWPGDGTDSWPALLPFLLSHASSPDYTVSFGWKPGDVVLWDNLATWHYAVNDYDGPRVYRKVIAG